MPDAFDAIVQVAHEIFSELDVDAARKSGNPLECPVALLGHLAWERGLDYWGSWPPATQRQVILQTPANLRRRGTVKAIRDALAPFAGQVTLTEWWEPGGSGVPGTAEVDAALGLVTDTDAQAFLREVLDRESRKSIHISLNIGLGGSGAVKTRAAMRLATVATFTGALN